MASAALTDTPHLELGRYCASEDMGTFGRLYVYRSPVVWTCLTVERPWLKNAPSVSCIPDGLYDLRLSYFNKGKYPSYQVRDVPDRTHILIHVGNTSEDVAGCIALGKNEGFVSMRWAVTESQKTFDQFMDVMNGVEEATLSIRG